MIKVRDFSMIFDAFSQFEESMIRAKMELANQENDDGNLSPVKLQINIKLIIYWLEEDETDAEFEGNDLEFRLARLEHLMDRRPLLLNSVLLR